MMRLLRKTSPISGDADETALAAGRTRFNRLAPSLLLALALASLFAFNADRARFYAPPDHDTGMTMAIAENLSPEHNFSMLIRLIPGENGGLEYEIYNRFPIGGFALVKLVIQPFGDNLPAQVFAGRMLMLALLSAAAFLAHRSIARITSNDWIALVAVLIAFSTYYILHHSDLVSVERMVDLFAVMLAFHGMAVFVQEGRFRQLVIKVCAALLLGWHVYAFLAPFVIIGLGSELIETIRTRKNFIGGSLGRDLLRTVIRSRYARIGAVALLFGFALLSFNIVSEYTAMNGEKSLTQLPTVRSMLYRTSLEGRPGDGFHWGDFLRGQFTRVVGATFPYALTNWPGASLETSRNGPPWPLAAIGILLTAASIAALLRVNRSRLLFATLALSGFFWALPMRRNTFIPYHDHEAIYYVGIPLSLAALLLLAAVRFGWERFLPAASSGALLVFALSAYLMITPDAAARERAARQEALYADAAAIREVMQENSALLIAHDNPQREVHLGYNNALHYYFTGNSVRFIEEGLPPNYDFVLFARRDENVPSLTPHNKAMFLYGPVDPSGLQRAWIDSIAAGAAEEPAVRSVYDVHLAHGALLYLKAPCGEADLAHRFFLHIFPERLDDLPESRRQAGFENFDFGFHSWGVAFDGECAARVPLPEYPIAAVRTGQFASGDGETWSEAIPFRE